MKQRDIPLIPSSQITSESVYLRRRELLKAGALLLPAWLSACGRSDAGAGERAAAAAPASTKPPAPAHSERFGKLAASPYSTGETQTTFRDASNYNNYYEFGTEKDDPARNAVGFVTQPWTVTVGGHAEHVGRFPLEDLVKPAALEERIYRMRCVEAWSMVIPWVGFPLASLIARLKPTSKAKYVAFTTLHAPERMPGQEYPVLDWPYREGLRMDEAMNQLTLLAVGMYGRELPNQNGAPLRLVVPWKYGYKGIKGIVAIDFVEKQPRTAWNEAAPGEYGFYSNVNPAVSHPRWSQKTERRIAGEFSLAPSRVETLPFNGYAEQVASLYAGMDLRKFH